MKTVKKYTVDLSEEDFEIRLYEFWEKGWAVNTARKLAEKAFAELEEYGSPVAHAVGKLAGAGTKIMGGSKLGYTQEMQEWADYANLSYSKFAAANLSFELYQIGTWLAQTPAGKAASKARSLLGKLRSKIGLCSSVAFKRPGIGLVHARNMDWPLPGIRGATILVDYTNGPAGDFTAVSVPGMVGVLSGVGKGRFSATINLAPGAEVRPNLTSGWSAALLQRYVFEYCEDYDEAVEILSEASVIAPVYIQVVGVKKGEACVIAVNPRGQNYIYDWDGGPLAVTNHDIGDPDYSDEDDWEEIEGEVYYGDSGARLDKILSEAIKCKAKTLEGCLSVLRQPPVFNKYSQQSLVMNAKKGDVLLQ